MAGYFLEAAIAHHQLTDGKDTRLYEAAKRLADMNTEPIGNTPAEMGQFVKRESEVWGKIIRSAGITAE